MSCKTATLGRGHIRREHVLNPITALAFYRSSTDGKQYVLAGEDTDIKIYDVQTSRFCGQLPVFQAQSIHGIAAPSEDASQEHRLILVLGGHSIKVIPGDTLDCLISNDNRGLNLERGVVEARAPDWIFDGRVSPFGDGRIVLLTAHNEVILAHVDDSRETLVFDSTRSPSRPILYSGNFFWASKDCVLVAAGTVFGEILVWKCHLDESPEGNQNSEVLFVFTGHEGSIFGVHISPKIQTAKGETLRLLASCSDDRTIRVWNITEKQEHVRQEYETHISDARETGFGNNVEVTADNDGSARCMATVMGHISRIWQVEFPQVQALSQVSDVVELYSFGEDATAQKWHLCLGPTAKLTHQSTFSNHSGKHIWSHATASTTSGDLSVATGGADGKIALIGAGLRHFSSVASSDDQSSTDDATDRGKAVSWSLADVTQSCQRTISPEEDSDDISKNQVTAPLSAKPKNAKEGFNRYTFVSDKRLLAATNSGRMFAGTFEDTGTMTWTVLNLPDEIGQIVFSHALLGASGANPMAFIGTTSGDIYYFDELGAPSLQLLTKIDGKVAQIFCLSDATKSHVKERGEAPGQNDSPVVAHGGSRLEILVTTLRSTQAAIVQVNTDDLTTRQLEVTLETGFMVTAAAFSQGYLVIGSRKGTVAVFHKLGDDKYSLLFTFVVQINEAITSMLPLRSRGDQSHNYVLSTCRDGKYRIHEIITAGTGQTAAAASAVLLHEAQPPFVSSIEGAWFSDSGGDGTDTKNTTKTTKTRDLMLCGFRSHNLVVWNETHRHEVATVDCGGASRSYAWTPRAGLAGGFRFVFTKAGHMRVFSQARDPHATLKSGGHGREIKTVSVSGSGRLVATAAEDTVIRIWEYEKEGEDGNGNGSGNGIGQKRLRCVAALEKHAAGVQALKWHGDEHLFSSAGNEEFFVWKINRLDSDDFAGLAVVCEAVFPDRTEVGDARITDFDVGYNACDGFRISMALSNSTLQTYAYTKETGFRLLSRSAYTGACLTQIRHLGDTHVLTAATDGHLAIYAITRQDAVVGGDDSTIVNAEALPVVTKLHQNTIKSLDIQQLASASELSEYIVVTGGDDNALGFMHVDLSSSTTGDSGVAIKSKSIVRSAHAAAITGVALAAPQDEKSEKEDDVLIVTSSNDQRVRIWRLGGWQKKQPRAQLLDERYSSVADAGDLEVFEDIDQIQGEDESVGRDGDRRDEALKEDQRRKRKVVVVGVGIEIWELGI